MLKRICFTFALLVFLPAAFAAAAPRSLSNAGPNEWEPFIDALADIQKRYVREATSTLLVVGAIDGIMEGFAEDIEDASAQARIRERKAELRLEVADYYKSLEPGQNFYRDFTTLRNYLRVIRRDMGRDFSTDGLVPNAIQGMVASLNDPHSVYLNPDRNKDFQKSISGDHDSFGGIGIHVAVKDDILTVISPLPDTPAARLGIKAGDRIVAVENESTKGLTIEECVARMKGEVGSVVAITVERDNVPEPIKYSVKRARIEVKNVNREMLTDDIGYIDVRQFEKGVTRDTHHALEFLTESGAEAVILDLRYNPGGLLDEAAAMSDLFLADGKTIVSTEGRLPGQEQEFVAQDHLPFEQKPEIVVLINAYSASASEILAGALKSHDRATIVGETSFGKGSVQQIFGQPDGSGLKLTIARYYTPDGICIDNIGIVPDIEYVKSGTETEELSAEEKTKQTEEYKKTYGEKLAVRLPIDPVLKLAVDTLLNERKHAKATRS